MSFAAKIFESFKAYTDEKFITAHLNQIFNQELQKLGIIFVDHSPIKVLDIASGPGDMLLQYLINVKCPKGFEVTFIDTNFVYTGDELGNERGLIFETLLSAQVEEVLPINNFCIINGRAFDISLGNLLAKSNFKIKDHAFNLLYISHGMYTIRSDGKKAWKVKIEDTILEIAGSILDTDGVAVIYNMASLRNTFLYFRIKYSRYKVNHKNDSISTDPSAMIALLCTKHSIPYYDLDFSAKLYFSNHIHEHQLLLKDYINHEKYLSMPAFTQDYNNLCFIISAKALNTIAGIGLLDSYVNEILSAIKLDKNGRWYLKIAEKMQVIASTKSSEKLRQKIKIALEKAKLFLIKD